jgi:hypothetical protein
LDPIDLIFYREREPHSQPEVRERDIKEEKWKLKAEGREAGVA